MSTFHERFDRLSHEEKLQFIEDVNYYCRKFYSTRDSRRAVEWELLDRDPILLSHLAAMRRDDENAIIEARRIEISKANRLKRLAQAWPMEKQRGSRINWSDLVPADIAAAQCQWERRRTAGKLKSAGFTEARIAQKFGVTAGRVNQWLELRRKDARSPVEVYQDRREPATSSHAAHALLLRLACFPRMA